MDPYRANVPPAPLGITARVVRVTVPFATPDRCAAELTCGHVALFADPPPLGALYVCTCPHPAAGVSR